jgi:hypothetical protein
LIDLSRSGFLCTEESAEGSGERGKEGGGHVV